MVPPDAFQVGEDLARHPRRGRAPRAGVRADPVPAADRVGAPAAGVDRAADDQQVLRPRPRTAAQPDRVPGRRRASGVRDVLAQPGRPAQRAGASTATARRSSTRCGPCRTSPTSRPRTCWRPAPGAFSPAWCWRTWPPPAPSTAWPASGCWSPCSTRPGRHGRRAGRRDDRRGGRRRVAAEGLPGRAQPGRGVRLAAARRPDLELLGQQLPAGQPPPAFDILFWNADTTRMTAQLHRDFVTVAMSNGLTTPGGSSLLGTEIDLAQGDRRLVRRRRHAPTTSARGSPATAAPSCSAGTAGSCCPPAVTSPRWSTRPATRSPASRPPRRASTTRPTRWSGSAGAHRAGLVVAGLRGLAGRTLRGTGAGAGVGGQQPVPRAGGRARQLRSRHVSIT